MKQAERVKTIQTVKSHLSALIAELESDTGLTDKITPEGRIMSDISQAVKPQAKRIDHALRLARSHK